MWPTGSEAIGVAVKGRIPAAEQAATGRALGRLCDIGRGNRLRPLSAEGAVDQPLPSDAVDAVVRVLADWAQGPGGWASGAPDGDPGRVPRGNSAQRVRALHGAFTLSAELTASLQAIPGPVFLVDDFADTGWTLAVAARLLRRAGATAVFPLVLAVQG